MNRASSCLIGTNLPAGLLIMVYVALAILATLRTPDTTKTPLEAMASQT